MYASMQENEALDAARVIAQSARRECTGNGISTAVLEEQICAEAGLWEPTAARRALDQAHGDPSHAVSMLRVWAATQPHVHALTVQPTDIVLTRRLTSAYPQIPGGQWLGFAPELIARQLEWTPRDDSGVDPQTEKDASPIPKPLFPLALRQAAGYGHLDPDFAVLLVSRKQSFYPAKRNG